MSKKTMYWFYPNDGGCNFHRVLQPARFCHERYDKNWHFEVGPGPAHGKDVYYFSGLPNVKEASSTLLEIQYIRRKGAKFVWSVDDDWLTVPDWNPAKPGDYGLCGYDIIKELADWIIVSTPALAKTFLDVSEKVFVTPNLLDLRMYPDVPSERFTDSDGRSGKRYDVEVKLPVRVVWVGSETHRKDVDSITDAMDKFLGTYGPTGLNRAIVIFCGMLPHGSIVRKYLHRGLFYQAMVPFASYHSVVGSLKPHIYLAPMDPNPFNLSKSNLRVIEGMAMMAPSVATNWGEYGNTVTDGTDGHLSFSSDEFYNNLVRLATDHEHRVLLASNGRMKVETQYDWNVESCRQPWYDALDVILGR